MKITKKLLSLLLAAVMLISAIPLSSADFLLSDIAFAEEREILDSGEMNENISWKLYTDGELVISGQGAMPIDDLYTEYTSIDDIYWLKYRDIITSVTVNEGITSVSSLMYLYNVTKVTLPEGLITIEFNTFAFMLKLKEINIPSTVKTISLYAFNCCLSLEELVLPEGLEEFICPVTNCMSLKELTIPGSVKKFSPIYIANCYSLKKLVLSEGTDLIMLDEMWGYTPEVLDYDKETADKVITNEWISVFISLFNIEYLEIPSSVTTGGEVNVTSSSLKEIRNYSSSLVIIPSGDFDYNKNVTPSINYSKNLFLESALSTFANSGIHESVADKSTFKDFDGYKFTEDLLGFDPSILFTESPADVDYDTFIEVLSAICEEEITSLNEFLYHSLLDPRNSVYTLPTGNAMIYCYDNSSQHNFIKEYADYIHLRHVLLDNNEECQNELILQKTYEATENHGEFSYEIDINSKTLYLSGSGNMPEWNKDNFPSYLHCRHLFNKVVFTEDSNIESISGLAFMDLENTTIYLPSSIRQISKGAFIYCSGTSLFFEKDFDFSGLLDFIDEYTSFKEFIVEDGHDTLFSFDGALYAYATGNIQGKPLPENTSHIVLLEVPQEKTEVEIYDKTTDILPFAFTGSMIEKITIPDSVIASSAQFLYCPNLKEINIGKNIDLSFNQCILPLSFYCPVEKINVDNENPYLTSDENGVLYTKDKSVLIQFPSVKKAEEYIIPEGVSVINTQAFFSNEVLKSVTISENVQEIKESAFTDMYSLQKITFLNPETKIYDRYTIPEYTVIYGYKGSTAEEFAEKYNRTFIEISGCVHSGGTATCEEKAICEKCGEEYGELASHTQATYEEKESCTVNGYILTYCAVCGEDLDFELIEAKHLWSEEYTEVTPATCTQEGLEKRTCGRCTEEETREIPKKDHDFEEAWTVDTEASCTEKGSESRHCKNCEAFTDQREIPEAEHNYGEWQTVKEATYTEEGRKERICSLCSTPETDTIPVLTTKEYKDEESGIVIEAGKDSYGGNDIKVSVKETFDGEHYLGQSFGKTAAWDISIYIDEEEVQPSTPVYVKIPVPEDFNEKKITVYHINSLTGEREKVPCEVIDGFVCFYATSFSVYIIVDESTLIEDDITDDDITDNCGHLCHKDGFLGFIWKIINFFSKLFNANPLCECGAAHY